MILFLLPANKWARRRRTAYCVTREALRRVALYRCSTCGSVRWGGGGTTPNTALKNPQEIVEKLDSLARLHAPDVEQQHRSLVRFAMEFDGFKKIGKKNKKLFEK